MSATRVGMKIITNGAVHDPLLTLLLGEHLDRMRLPKGTHIGAKMDMSPLMYKGQ